MTELLFIDLDGTLADTRRDLAAAVNHMLKSFSFPQLPVEAVVGMLGDGFGALIGKALAGRNADFDLALATARDYYMEHLADTTELYPQVRESLQTLADNGVRNILLSNKLQSATEKLVAKFGIGENLAEVIGGNVAYPLKPAPDAILAMLDKYQADPGNCWIVGDNFTDIAAGSAAGIKTILAEYGFGRLKELQPQFRIKSFAELIDLLLEKDAPQCG